MCHKLTTNWTLDSIKLKFDKIKGPKIKGFLEPYEEHHCDIANILTAYTFTPINDTAKICGRMMMRRVS
jgi:hypothetical protein